MADISSLLGAAGIGGSIGKAIVSLELETTKYQAELAKAEAETKASTTNSGAAVSKFGGLASKAWLGVGIAAVAGVAASVKAAAEAERVMAQTEAVIKSTGGAANVTADQVVALSERLRDLSGVDDEVIQASSNLLLTFRDIRNEVGAGNDIFDQAQGAILDMATAMNEGAIPSSEDLHSATIQLGKALNSPVQGMSALARVGVSFTESQIATIKALQESGDLMGAQKLILAELNKEFGGAAKAAGETFSGQLAILQSKLGDVAERIGNALLPALQGLVVILDTAVVPALEGVVSGVELAFSPDTYTDIPIIGEIFKGLGDVIQHVGFAFDQTGRDTATTTDFVQQAGTVVAQTEKECREYARTLKAANDETKDAAEHTKKLADRFKELHFDLEDVADATDVSRDAFAKYFRTLEGNAADLKRAAHQLQDEKWLDQDFVDFLSSKGPEWIVRFGDLNERQQQRWQASWEESNKKTHIANEELDNLRTTLDKIDQSDTKHKITIEYEYVNYDPSKPGMISQKKG